MPLGAGRRANLDQPLDLEAGASQDVDPVAVRQLELDPGLRRPLETVHAEVRPLELLATAPTAGQQRKAIGVP